MSSDMVLSLLWLVTPHVLCLGGGWRQWQSGWVRRYDAALFFFHTVLIHLGSFCYVHIITTMLGFYMYIWSYLVEQCFLISNYFLYCSCFSDEAFSADSDDESVSSSSSESSSSSSLASSSSSDEEDEEEGEQAAESESLDTMDESTMDSVAMDKEKGERYVPLWEPLQYRVLCRWIDKLTWLLSVFYRDKASIDQSSVTAVEVKLGQLKITLFFRELKW